MQDIKFWNDMVNHPDYDDWWKACDARRACYNIKPAMMEVGGTLMQKIVLVPGIYTRPSNSKILKPATGW